MLSKIRVNILQSKFMFIFRSVVNSSNEIQCSPYQAETGKIYSLKQHFLLPAAA